MRIAKTSITEWAWISHLADSSLTVTKDGLQINRNVSDFTIPWAEIDAARDLFVEDGDSIPAEMMRQRQEAMSLRREIITHNLLKKIHTILN